MALSPQALVTVEQARAYLGVGSTDLPKDELLEQIIEGLSAHIVWRSGRTYISDSAKDDPSVRSFTFDPGSTVAPIDDARSVTKVEVSATPGDAVSWTELAAATDYVLEDQGEPTATRVRFLNPQQLPSQGVGWSGLSLHTRTASGSPADTMGTPWPNRVRAENAASAAVVRVTAKWGFGKDQSTVPPDVKLALNMWLQNIHKRDQAFFSEDFGKAMAGLKMPKDVEALLRLADGEGATVGAV